MPHVGTQARAETHVTLKQNRRLPNDDGTAPLPFVDSVRQWQALSLPRASADGKNVTKIAVPDYPTLNLFLAIAVL